jgi:hypothetical protein
MITAEQLKEIKGRDLEKLRVFSGDVYAPQPDRSVIAIDPDGHIRPEIGMPRRGVTLRQMAASDEAIRSMLGGSA